jgi:hypothetical protein
VVTRTPSSISSSSCLSHTPALTLLLEFLPPSVEARAEGVLAAAAAAAVVVVLLCLLLLLRLLPSPGPSPRPGTEIGSHTRPFAAGLPLLFDKLLLCVLSEGGRGGREEKRVKCEMMPAPEHAAADGGGAAGGPCVGSLWLQCMVLCCWSCLIKSLPGWLPLLHWSTSPPCMAASLLFPLQRYIADMAAYNLSLDACFYAP